MKISGPKVEIPKIKRKKAPRYTPVSRRQDRPNAILWLLKHHPELMDSQIIRLVGTTKPTIAAIRERTHWNSANLAAQDPVALGLCTQIDLDAEVQKGAKRLEKERIAKGEPETPPETLLPTDETTPDISPQERLALIRLPHSISPRVNRKWKRRNPTLTPCSQTSVEVMPQNRIRILRRIQKPNQTKPTMSLVSARSRPRLDHALCVTKDGRSPLRSPDHVDLCY